MLRLMFGKLVPTAALAIATAVALATPAGATPLFGPQTYERTSGASDVYEDRFDAPAGSYTMFLRNGDAESHRVSSATVSVNGTTVLAPADFDEQTAGLQVRIELEEGSNTVSVELSGDPGSFITLAIGPVGERPRFVRGRLILPWARHVPERALVLAFKNGSPHAPRALRVLFYAPSGEIVAASERLALSPSGSVALPVDALIDRGQWEVGSIEVVFAGHGVARVFGSVRWIDPIAGEVELSALEPAGLRVFRGRDHAAPSPAGRMR